MFSKNPRNNKGHDVVSRALFIRGLFAVSQIVIIALLLVVTQFNSTQASGSLAGGRPAVQPTIARTTTTTSSNSGAPVTLSSSLRAGIYIDNSDPATYEASLGRKTEIVAWFKQWNSDLAGGKLAEACAQGYVPLITWESWTGKSAPSTQEQSYLLGDIANGAYDDLITQNLQRVRQACGNQNVIIRFDHEMDTPRGVVGWYPWQGNPGAYVAAWKHIVAISRTTDPHIQWLWSPNRGTTTALAYYPGDQWVDYVGLTLNHGTLERQYLDFRSFYIDNQAVIESFGKPIIIGETSSDESLGNKAAWISDMFDYLQGNPKVAAFVWFNGNANYSYKSSIESIDAFKSGLRDLQ